SAVIIIVTQVAESAVLFVEHINAVGCADPDVMIVILNNGGDIIGMQRTPVFHPVVMENVFFPVVPVQSAAERSYPQVFITVFKYFPDAVVGNAARIGSTVPELCELFTVVAIQSAKIGAYP